jgi:CarD family transcriptional regulator
VDEPADANDYQVGDKVVYPQHGAGSVVQRERRTVLGEEADYLTIRVLASDMTVMVRADRADEAGIRRVIGPAEVETLLGVLRGDDIVIPGNWNRRFKHNREKMRSGDVLELAEVIRNLTHRGAGKPLSSGERQMLARAKHILASELQYALDMEEHEALQYLDDLLEEIATERQEAAGRATT